MNIKEFKERKNTHQTHLEDLVLLGKDGIEELNDKIDKFIARIGGDKSGSNLTTKIDGAPAVVCWSEFTDYPANSICLKSFVTSNKNCLSSEEDIEAKYGDRPDMAVKLKYCLELAHSIPAGEAWQGDCLYSKNDLREIEIGDTNYLTFQPNKIVYAFSEDNPSYEVIKNSNFGICFHTIYKGNLEHKNQSFNVDASNLNNVPSDIYVMSPTLDTDDVSYDIASIQSQYDELKNLEANLISDSAYEELVNNSVFMDYWNTFENANLSDKKATNINAETFIDDLKAYISDKIRAKGYKKLETTEEKIKYFSDFIDANTDTLRNLVALLNKASDVKMTLWNSLKNAKQNYSTFYKHREQGYIPANMEGAAFSDQDGNIVKIVDRSSFSNVNRDTNYLSGFEHEGLDMNIRKIKNESKSYNGYKIRQDHRYGGFNIYDKNGELEDSGFKSEEDAMNEIDKICNDKQLKEGNTLDKNAIAKEFNIKPNTVKCFYCKFWGANMKGGVSTRTGAKCSKLKKVTVANQHCKDFSPDMTRISQKKSGLEEEVDPVFKDFVFAVEQCLRQSFYKLPPIHEIQWADSVEIPFDYDRKQWIPSSASIKKFLKDKYGLNVKVSRMTSNWAYEKEIIMTIKLIRDEAIKEDTVKTSDGKWTNKGDEGTHGKFKTKKEADAQRKAMFANGYHEELDTEELDAFEEEFNESMNIIREDDNKFSSVITEADTELWDYFNKATEEFRQEINSLKKKLSRCKDYYAGMAEAMTNGDITNTDTIDALMAWYNHSDLSVSEVLAKAK